MSADSLPRERSFTGSIVVPAHNEAGRIGPLLSTLSEFADTDGVLVIVSCNGCTDFTADLARATPHVKVLESSTRSKTEALNRAEELADDVFPRLYVDADVIISSDSLRLLMDALRAPIPMAVRPVGQHLFYDSSWIVRVWYQGRALTPSSTQWSSEHLEGNAVYGTNTSGRAKFETFPALLADDAFFDRMFDLDEKSVVEGATVAIPSPKTLRSLLRTLVRINEGNQELSKWLLEHRPDRVHMGHLEMDPALRANGSWHYYRHGGSTFSSWRPKSTLYVILVLLIRRVARLNAWFISHRGKSSPWR